MHRSLCRSNPHNSTRGDFLGLWLDAIPFSIVGITTRPAERLGGTTVIVCTLGPPSAGLQSKNPGKGDATDEVARRKAKGRST